MEDQEPSKVETIVKVCVLLWSATLLSLSYYEPPSGKKIVDFDPTFIASIFSASTASLGFQIKKKKDTIVDNKNSKVGIKMKKTVCFTSILTIGCFCRHKTGICHLCTNHCRYAIRNYSKRWVQHTL